MAEDATLSACAEFPDAAGVEPAQLAALSDAVGIDINDGPADHFDAATAELNRITRATIRMGLHLIAAQASTPRGDFVRTIEERGFPRQRAYEAIKVVRMLLAAAAPPAEKSAKSARADKSVDDCRPRLQRLIAMGPARLEALSRLDPEVIESADTDLLDDVEAMPVQMLRREVRRLRRKNQDLSARADKSETALREATAGDGAPVPGSEFPPSVVRARSEAAAHADQAIARIQSIARHAETIGLQPDIGAANSARADNLRNAAGPLYLHLSAIRAAADEALRTVEHCLGGFLPADWSDPVQHPLPLSPDQARQLAVHRDTHLRRMDLDATLRDDARMRAGEIKRTAGRPRKTERAELQSAPRRQRGRPRKNPLPAPAGKTA